MSIVGTLGDTGGGAARLKLPAASSISHRVSVSASVSANNGLLR